MTNNWSPLITGDDAQPYLSAIDDIVRDLRVYDGAHRGSKTNWGAALLHGYLAAARQSDADWSCSDELREQLAGEVASERLHGGLHGGIAGFGWLFAHLDLLRGEPQEDDDYAEVDMFVSHLAQSPLADGYDLIGGCVGLGLYCLERLPNPAAYTSLHQIADGLVDAAVTTSSGLTWHTPAEALPPWQRKLAPQGYYNVGVAHGVPGVVGLFAEMSAAGAGSRKSDAALAETVRWVLAQALPDGAFPSWVGPGLTPSRSRVAWCYGELGVCVTLLHAARVLSDNLVESAAIDIARRCAARVDISSTLDAPLCHGASGNAHLFNRLFQATGHDEFRAAALAWYRRALDMRQPGRSLGGFCAWRPLGPDEQPRADPWEEEPSFLSGASGVGLAFLAATSAVEPAWDRMLLASVARPPVNAASLEDRGHRQDE